MESWNKFLETIQGLKLEWIIGVDALSIIVAWFASQKAAELPRNIDPKMTLLVALALSILFSVVIVAKLAGFYWNEGQTKKNANEAKAEAKRLVDEAEAKKRADYDRNRELILKGIPLMGSDLKSTLKRFVEEDKTVLKLPMEVGGTLEGLGLVVRQASVVRLYNAHAYYSIQPWILEHLKGIPDVLE